MVTYKIHIIRAGTALTDSTSPHIGGNDTSLSDIGKAQLLAMKENFEYPFVDTVYSSPMIRCIETANLLYPYNEVRPLDSLRALSLGEFESKTYEQLEKEPAFKKWLKNSAENPVPGGEDLITFSERIISALNSVFHEMMQEQVFSTAIITHNGVIMTLLAAIGQPKLPLNEWSVDNCTGFTLLMTPQLWMRDYTAEVFSRVPILKEEPATDESSD